MSREIPAVSRGVVLTALHSIAASPIYTCPSLLIMTASIGLACELFHIFSVTYSLDFLHNLDTRAMTDPGAILGVDDDPEKVSDQR